MLCVVREDYNHKFACRDKSPATADLMLEDCVGPFSKFGTMMSRKRSVFGIGISTAVLLNLQMTRCGLIFYNSTNLRVVLGRIGFIDANVLRFLWDL